MKDKLNILWTNADPITAEMMVFMYAENAILRGWWKEVQIIVWGATTKLVAENERIQERLLHMKESGVDINFCLACANELGLAEEIQKLGFNLDYMGIHLTDLLKNDEKLLTI